MHDNRTAGWMLVAGCAAGLITMALHPTLHLGVSLTPAQLTRLATLDRVVHALAIGGIILIFLGTLALTHRLTSANQLSLIALVVYGFAAVLVVAAGTLDGFVAADLVDRMAAGDPKAEGLWMLLDYNTRIVVALASVYVVGTSIAIFLWSLAALQTRRLATGLGWYGLIVAPLIVLALFGGHLRLDVHGFGLVMLAQSIWFVVAGCLLHHSADSSPVL